MPTDWLGPRERPIPVGVPVRGAPSARGGEAPGGQGETPVGQGETPVGQGEAAGGQGETPVGQGEAGPENARGPASDWLGPEAVLVPIGGMREPKRPLAPASAEAFWGEDSGALQDAWQDLDAPEPLEEPAGNAAFAPGTPTPSTGSWLGVRARVPGPRMAATVALAGVVAMALAFVVQSQRGSAPRSGRPSESTRLADTRASAGRRQVLPNARAHANRRGRVRPRATVRRHATTRRHAIPTAMTVRYMTPAATATPEPAAHRYTPPATADTAAPSTPAPSSPPAPAQRSSPPAFGSGGMLGPGHGNGTG